MGKKLFGFIDEVAKGAKGLVDDAAPAVLETVQQGFKVSGDEAIEAGTKSTDDFVRQLLESRVHERFAGDFRDKVQKSMGKVHGELSNYIARAESQRAGIGRLGKVETELLENTPQSEKALQQFIMNKGSNYGLNLPEEIAKEGGPAIKAWIREQAKHSTASLKQAEANLHYAQRATKVLNQPDGAMQLSRLLDEERKLNNGLFGSGLEAAIPGFRDLMFDVKRVGELDFSRKSTSDFVIKALELKSDNPATFGLFLANPKNYDRWAKLRRSTGYVGELIEKGSPRIPFKRQIIGITPGETAKRIGIPLSAGAGIIGLYHWFGGKNDPAQVSASAGAAATSVQTLNVGGEGAQIVAGVQQSMSTISTLGKEVDSQLSTPKAAEATTKYIQGMSRELMILMNALKRWPTVVQNSNDPNAARAEGKKLYQFIQTQVSGLNDLSKQLGINVQMPGTSAPGIANLTTQRGPYIDNLKKIQGFLNIGETGRLDAATIKSLRTLEYIFNKRARTDQFTGTFVVPEAGHIISYDNLVTAYKKIQKYDESEYAQ